MSPHNKKIEIPCSSPQSTINESKIVSNLCSIWSTCWVPNGYGYLPGMGMGKDSHPWVRVWVKLCTHRLYRYGYGIALPCPLPSLIAKQTCTWKVHLAARCRRSPTDWISLINSSQRGLHSGSQSVIGGRETRSQAERRKHGGDAETEELRWAWAHCNTPDINPIWQSYTNFKHCQRPGNTMNFSKVSFVKWDIHDKK
jgi:hypothetical protein